MKLDTGKATSPTEIEGLLSRLRAVAAIISRLEVKTGFWNSATVNCGGVKSPIAKSPNL